MTYETYSTFMHNLFVGIANEVLGWWLALVVLVFIVWVRGKDFDL